MGKEESDKSRFGCKVKLYKIKCKKLLHNILNRCIIMQNQNLFDGKREKGCYR